jgi:uncharacterized protein YbjT (DUF2867 family)
VIELPPAAATSAAARLVAALAGGAGARAEEPATLVVAQGLAPADVDAWVAAHRGRGPARLLILTRVGVHRDARAPALRALWDLEERARAAGLPALTLRLAPLVGPASPFWLKLAARPRLPRGGRQLLNPVCEEDALATVRRALEGGAAWEGWYEVAGPEVWSLGDLAALAAEWAPPRRPNAPRGAWEPPLGELAEHRLCEAGPWLEHFGISAAPLAPRARAWAAPAAGEAAARARGPGAGGRSAAGGRRPRGGRGASPAMRRADPPSRAAPCSP